jgi:predicted nucleic acid-binding protein
MAKRAGSSRARTRSRPWRTRELPVRYTIDASVFVNAFNPHEDGHDASLTLLTAIHDAGDPVIVPALALPEIASAVARATDDTEGAVAYAAAVGNLPHVTLVSLTPAAGREAASLAALHRLRSADAVYAWTARRYGTTLVSRDDQQRTRAAAVLACVTPKEALRQRNVPE